MRERRDRWIDRLQNADRERERERLVMIITNRRER